MALSDCIKCWDTPCTCGHEWEKYNKEQLEKHLVMILDVYERKYPNIECSLKATELKQAIKTHKKDLSQLAFIIKDENND